MSEKFTIGKIEQLTETGIKDEPISAHFLQVIDKTGRPMVFPEPKVSYSYSKSSNELALEEAVSKVNEKIDDLLKVELEDHVSESLKEIKRIINNK